MDLSRLSTEDLKALQRGDMSAVSTEGLRMLAGGSPPPQVTSSPLPAAQPPQERSRLAETAAGVASGFADVGNTLINGLTYPLRKMSPTVEQWNQERQDSLKSFNNERDDSNFFKVGRVGGNVAATWPVAGVIAAPVQAAGRVLPALAKFTTPLAEALATGGMRAGPALPGAAAAAGRLAARTAGGAAVGGASAALVNPEDAGTGAAIGAVLPGALALAGRAGQAAGGLVQPFFKAGQERIAGKTLNEFASDPAAALANLRNAAPVVPGSAPTTVQAAGDVGLAGLNRTMASANPAFGADLTARLSTQNAARTNLLESVAGNAGKLDAAKAARDAATAQMRESALQAAGQLDSQPILRGLDSMLKNPNNAGRISQQALAQVRQQIGGLVDEAGRIDSRALYAIRKDINDVLGGKLQGEAGNMRYASGQLTAVKDMIDNAIEQAATRSNALPGSAAGSAPARGGWKAYLDEYTRQSVPINQMETLADVMRRVQTGTTDTSGNLVLSAAKLNNILKNEGAELRKTLAPDQLDMLRKLAADLNASQTAANAGRAVGSNTVQNLAGAQMLTSTLGQTVGGSAPVQSAVGRVLQLPYGMANTQIQDRLGAALLDPQEAARLMELASRPGAVQRLFQYAPAVPQVAYRAAPVLAADR